MHLLYKSLDCTESIVLWACMCVLDEISKDNKQLHKHCIKLLLVWVISNWVACASKNGKINFIIWCTKNIISSLCTMKPWKCFHGVFISKVQVLEMLKTIVFLMSSEAFGSRSDVYPYQHGLLSTIHCPVSGVS